MLFTLLCLLLCGWCWLGRGPRFLRWPALVLTIAFTSGHPLLASLAPELEALAAPLLTLLIVLLGLTIMLRGVLWKSHRRHRDFLRDRYERRWHDDWW